MLEQEHSRVGRHMGRHQQECSIGLPSCLSGELIARRRLRQEQECTIQHRKQAHRGAVSTALLAFQ